MEEMKKVRMRGQDNGKRLQKMQRQEGIERSK